MRDYARWGEMKSNEACRSVRMRGWLASTTAMALTRYGSWPRDVMRTQFSRDSYFLNDRLILVPSLYPKEKKNFFSFSFSVEIALSVDWTSSRMLRRFIGVHWRDRVTTDVDLSTVSFVCNVWITPTSRCEIVLRRRWERRAGNEREQEDKVR